MCHNVEEGDVLGGATVYIDISNELAQIDRETYMMWTAMILLLVLLQFVIYILMKIFVIRSLMNFSNLQTYSHTMQTL
ncbi:MAG: hypothetical protein IE887_01240 [Campylobacterales bacterium]|nr:hypothetical protein [Campylobacterales bacterium]